MSHRYISGQIPRATHRTIVMHQFNPNVKAGVEWNQGADEIGIVANWRILPESHRRPALIIGTSSDRIGTPDGQSYYATISKSLHHLVGIPVAPYAGVSYSEHEGRVIYPFGLNGAIGRHWSAMLMNDGVHTHLSASYAWQRFSLTLLAVERKDFGLTAGVRF